MKRASGTERASRSSLGTTRVSPCANSGKRLVEAGPGPVGTGQAVVGVDAFGGDAELFEAAFWAARSCLSVEQRA